MMQVTALNKGEGRFQQGAKKREERQEKGLWGESFILIPAAFSGLGAMV